MSISTLFTSLLRHTSVHNTIFRCFAVSATMAMCGPSFAEIKDLRKFGDPLWTIEGFVQSTIHGVGHNGRDANINTQERQTEMLGGTHEYIEGRNALTPGTPHDGPYDLEFRVAMAESGEINTDVFLASDLVLPNLQLLNYVVAPTQDAPLGASNDFSLGPIIPNDAFPFEVRDNFTLNGDPLPSHVHRFNPLGINHSHIPVYDLSGRGGGQVIGLWEGKRKIRDAQGNGYDFTETFTVVANPTDIPGDLSYDEELDHHDLNILTQNVAVAPSSPKDEFLRRLDLNDDKTVDVSDIHYWVTNLKSTWIGDANLDGEFNSSDFVAVFKAGKYETGERALWSDGDWNGDELFDSGDFIVAFQGGGYELGERAAVATVPEPSSLLMLMLGMLGIGRIRRR